MAIQYRGIWSDAGESLLAAAREMFNEWIRDKGHDVELPASGTIPLDKADLTVVAMETPEASVLRTRLREEVGPALWTTTMTVLVPGVEVL